MPRAVLPSSPFGWFIFVIVGFVGAIAGFVFLWTIEQLGLA